MVKKQANITTKQAISLLRLINKMEIKEILVDSIGELAKLEREKKKTLKELYKFLPEGEEITNATTEKLFIENKEIAEKYAEVISKGERVGLDLILEIMVSVPNAEKDFYKTVSEIGNVSIMDAEEMPLQDSIEILIDVFKSESFVGFFKSTMK